MLTKGRRGPSAGVFERGLARRVRPREFARRPPGRGRSGSSTPCRPHPQPRQTARGGGMSWRWLARARVLAILRRMPRFPCCSWFDACRDSCNRLRFSGELDVVRWSVSRRIPRFAIAQRSTRTLKCHSRARVSPVDSGHARLVSRLAESTAHVFGKCLFSAREATMAARRGSRTPSRQGRWGHSKTVKLERP